MKTQVAFLVLLFFAVPMAMADYLVLTNGKRIHVPAGYQVKGQFVVFSNAAGELNQLPLKIVDLEKSKAYSKLKEEEAAAKALALKEAQEQRQKQVDKNSSMAEIAAYVEKHRDAENPKPSGVSISDDELQDYSANNPMRENEQVAFNPSGNTEYTPAAAKARRAEYGEGYQKLVQEIDQLEKQIKEAEYRRDNNASIAAFGGDTFAGTDEDGNDVFVAGAESSSAYDEMEKLETTIKELKTKKSDKESQLKSYEKEARAAGVKDYKRYKAPRDKKQEYEDRRAKARAEKKKMFQDQIKKKKRTSEEEEY